MKTADHPGVVLQHIPEWVARKLDELYGTVGSGSITVHMTEGGPVKFETRRVESAKAAHKQ